MCKKIFPKFTYLDGVYKHQKISHKVSIGDRWECNVIFSCGYCEDCRTAKMRNWIVRNYFESKVNPPVYFLSLTYREPLQSRLLDYKDLQDFIKRLRKHYKVDIRYYGCGELGSRYLRPHFHLLIYSSSYFIDDLIVWEPKADTVYLSRTMEGLWKHGMAFIQKCDGDSSLTSYITVYNSKSGYMRESLVTKYKITSKHYRAWKRYCENEKSAIYLDRYVATYILFKREFSRHKEKQVFSTSIGYQYFYENCRLFLDNRGVVYIDGYEYGIPLNYFRKLASDPSVDFDIHLDCVAYLDSFNLTPDKEKALLAKRLLLHSKPSKYKSHIKKYDNDIY